MSHAIATPARSRSSAVTHDVSVSDSNVTFTNSSGNLFADIGLPTHDIDQMKLEVAVAINSALQSRGNTQGRRANVLGVDQSTISLLENFELSRFTLDRLVRYASTLQVPLASPTLPQNYECMVANRTR